MSQTYLLESQTKKTLKNPVVFKTFGKVLNHSLQPDDEPGAVVPEEHVEDDFDEIAELGGVLQPVEVSRSETSRLAQKLCYICKLKIGSNHSLRIGEYFVFLTTLLKSYFSVPYQGVHERGGPPRMFEYKTFLWFYIGPDS